MEEEQDDFGPEVGYGTGTELSFTRPHLTFDADAEGLGGFGQAEAQLAGVGVQEEPIYEWLVEFEFRNMGHVTIYIEVICPTKIFCLILASI